MQTIVLEMLEWSVNSKLGSSPVSPFGVIPRKILINQIIKIPDVVICLITEPVGKRSVLFGLLDQSAFDLHRFVWSLYKIGKK